MKAIFIIGIIGCLAHVIRAPPVTQKKPEAGEKDAEIKDGLEDYMEYHRYLKEVVQALESDPEFREKMEKAEDVDIRTGKIAHELDFVNHSVRTQLDEIKRQELERLRHLATKQFELTNDVAEHLDHNNPHTFEIEDLKKLIHKTTADLAEADKKRRDDFKQYEMQKEFEKQQKLQGLDESHRKEFEKELHDQEEKHKKHEPLHHPGGRQQLEEVWEKQDHMENQDFDPKTFFMLHDVDSNGVWDQTEVKALFLKELDKMYVNGAPEDDMRERQEEMERMREHVFREADTNGDGLISYEEFLVQTRRDEFEKDRGWKGLDEQQVYTQEEYLEFERRQLEEVQKLVQQGRLPPQAIYNHQGQQFHPNAHPNAIPQHGGYQQHPGQQQYHNQQPQYQQQYHPNAVPQPQYQQPQYNQGHPQMPPVPQGGVQNPQGHPQPVYNQNPQYHAQNQGQVPQQPHVVQPNQMNQPPNHVVVNQIQNPEVRAQPQGQQQVHPQGQQQLHPQAQQQAHPQAQQQAHPQAQQQAHPQAQQQVHPQAHPQAQQQTQPHVQQQPQIQVQNSDVHNSVPIQPPKANV